MKVFKTLLFIALVSVSSQLMAQAKQIEFHATCETQSADCVEMTDVRDSTKKKIVNKEVLLAITPENMVDIKVIRDGGQENLTVNLDRDSTEKFAALTRNLLNREVAIIVEGKLAIAPVVRSEITSGSFQITLSNDKGFNLLETVTWLKDLTSKHEAAAIQKQSNSVVAYAVIGGLFFLGILIYLLIGRTKSSDIPDDEVV